MNPKPYHMRVRTRLSWAKISELCGYSSPDSAWRAAKNYSLKKDLPWPPATLLTAGEIAYYERAAGLDWPEIQDILNLPLPCYAQTMARKYCLSRELPWPPKQRGESR